MIMLTYGRLTLGTQMRRLLFLAVLVAQVISVEAATGKKANPNWRLLTAIVRYCVVSVASEKANGATCQYDCLMRKRLFRNLREAFVL
jgi:hypothetical protein